MDDYGQIPYEDISELKSKLEGLKDKKDVPSKDMFEAVHQLAGTMHDLLEIFAAAAEQLKIEEKDYETENKKHELIISRLDKLIDQNKTIAEGMVAMVEMIKEKFGSIDRQGEQMFKQDDSDPIFSQPQPQEAPKPEPKTFMRQQWKPQPERQAPQPQPKYGMPPMPPPQMMPLQMMPLQSSNYEPEMPPMEPSPMPDLDLPEEPLPFDDEPKKKSIFGMFKK